MTTLVNEIMQSNDRSKKREDHAHGMEFKVKEESPRIPF